MKIDNTKAKLFKNILYKIQLLFTLLLITNFMHSQNNEFLEDLNLSNFNKDFSNYDQLTSVYCSQLSEIAYWDSVRIESFYKLIDAKYSNDNHHFVLLDHKGKKDHTQALLWGNSSFLIIAFRGTEPKKIRDWISDVKFWNYKNNPSSNEELANMPPGHGGFRRSLISLITKENLFEEIDKMIERCAPDLNKSSIPIYLTGHSLGAALSQLFIEPLNYKGYNFSGAYHFAPPLAVSSNEYDYMKTNYGDKVYDIVNYKDYVPRAGRNNVSHFGKFYRICKDGLIYSEKEAYIKFGVFEYLKEFKYHTLSNHLKAIKDTRNTDVNIHKRSVGDYPCLRPK